MEPSIKGAMALVKQASGPLSPHLETYISSLVEEQYSVISVRTKAWHTVAFDAWLSVRSIHLKELSDTHIDQFHQRCYQPRSDCFNEPRCHEVAEIRQLLRYLREHKLCEPAKSARPPTNDIVNDFNQFLLNDRGLAVNTVRSYCSNAKDFLIYHFGTDLVELSILSAKDIISFVRAKAPHIRPRTLKQVISGLRAFLRYAAYRGEISSSLVSAVPAVASWSTKPSLPRAIDPSHASALINSCNLNTPVGLRDRAILLLLARLGLRGGEVITLVLEDIDWGAGNLKIHGKNGCECLMPMPADVGEAIAAYLQHGRQHSPDRHVFLRMRAPIRGMIHGSDAVGAIVSNALIRAGINTPHKGSHQFRHALAVNMLQKGASIPEIGDMLRHRSATSTSIYARIDISALRGLAIPWPGRKS
ncbi:tyrosine-type recombinase/integrase [Rahnella sp. CG8]|uniref:tyrosine-type recombinase/integrase n=1 Tax=Rahnella sp. CG8 TaxID=2726078 RepID=UPI0020344784|nr:tyrosine-type recombinase/integrase [Rahnella sp. CG8]MCM2446243.1 tyrosine-type recombinase/integrase [Rahnella sp. CG8]